jgi:hypothetical protein
LFAGLAKKQSQRRRTVDALLSYDNFRTVNPFAGATAQSGIDQDSCSTVWINISGKHHPAIA